MRIASPAFSLVFCSRGCHSFHSSLSLSGASRSVSFHGSASLRRSPRNTRTTATAKLSPSGTHTHAVGEKPPDPRSYKDALEDNVDQLHEWFRGKNKILCLTGAGISTESGIPDYRGHNGSYHQGHKPMIHDQFIKQHKMRQRYWGRAMIGWREFANAMPNEGHQAISRLETMGKIGSIFDDSNAFYKPNCENAELNWAFSAGYQKMSIITQNVDGLHIKAGSNRGNITELHGRNDRLACMKCGSHHCRHEFHDQLDTLNVDWLRQQQLEIAQADGVKQLRPDGDAFIQKENYDDMVVPPCPNCIDDNEEHGFLKPDVVFFGDSVPQHRVNRCFAAVDASDGLLCIGSSLAVHSAYRFVKRAAANGTPIAILNVGETRAEIDGMKVQKIEGAAGPTLRELVRRFEREENLRRY